MRKTPALVLVFFAHLSCGDEAPPETLRCPQSGLRSQVTPENAPLHWELGSSCLQVSYSRGAAKYSAEIKSAVAAWSSTECGLLCIAEPIQLETPRETDSIHVTILEGSSGSISPIENTYRLDDGALLRAKISLNEPELPENMHRLMLYNIGRALGFEGTEEVVSVMNTPLEADPLSELTEEDIAGFCAKYGARCER
jgi:hypothetical protein